jgi:hypothetical protein
MYYGQVIFTGDKLLQEAVSFYDAFSTVRFILSSLWLA